jgi:hypothetical protein
MYVCISVLLSNDAAKLHCSNQYISNNKRVVTRVVFCAVRVVSNKIGRHFFLELLVFAIVSAAASY